MAASPPTSPRRSAVPESPSTCPAAPDLYFLEGSRVMICKTHHTALKLSQLTAHLKSSHESNKATLKSVNLWKRHLIDFDETTAYHGWSQAQIFLDIIPDRKSDPVVGLECEQGYACAIGDCRYASAREATMRKHIKTVHQLKQARGVSVPNFFDDKFRSKVYVQRFFKQGPMSAFFEVKFGTQWPEPNGGSIAPQHIIDDEDVVPVLPELIAQFTEPAAKMRIQKNVNKDPTEELNTANPWYQKSGVLRHINKTTATKSELLGFTTLYQAPKNFYNIHKDIAVPGAHALLMVYASIDRIVEFGRLALVSGSISRGACIELNRVSHRPEVSTRPYEHKQTRQTYPKYARVWKRLVTYIFKTEGLQGKDKPPYYLDPTERSALTSLNTTLKSLLRDLPLNSKPAELEDPESVHRLKQLDHLVLDLLYAVMARDLEPTEYSSVMISFVAVYHLKRDDQMEDIQVITQAISALITLGRLFLLVREIFSMVTENPDLYVDGFDDSIVGHSCLSLKRRIIKQNFIYSYGPDSDEQKHPFLWLANLRSYGFKVQKNTPKMGHVVWDCDTIAYRDVILTPTLIRGAIKYGLRHAGRVLFEELLFVPKPGQTVKVAHYMDYYLASVPAVSIESISDSFENTQAGYSKFGLILEEGTFGFNQEWLINRISSSNRLRARFFPGMASGSLSWAEPDPRQLNFYLKQVAIFLEYLLALVHITSGMPARGPEITTIRHCNGLKEGPRNIYMSQGLVEIVTGYSKTYSMTGSLQIIHRFCPFEVGQLLVLYRLLVLPFVDNCIAKYTQDEQLSDRLFPGQLEKQKVRDPLAPLDGSQDTTVPIQDIIQFRPNFDSQKLTLALKNLFFNSCGVKGVTIASWRHIAPAMSTHFIVHNSMGVYTIRKEGDTLNDLDEDDRVFDDDIEDEEDKIAALQSAHTVETARNIYGRLLKSGDLINSELQAKFRRYSVSWHVFCGFEVPDYQTGIRTSSTFNRQLQQFAANNQKSRFEALQKADLISGLRRLYGPSALFRGQQHQALQAIIERKRVVIAIFGTGVGKSLLFLLPAFLSSRSSVTIVIVPLVAIVEDLHRRCQSMNIPSLIWSYTSPTETSKLIFTTPESATSAGFRSLVNMLVEARRLDRFVFDECDMVFDGSVDFRPELMHLGELPRHKIQTLFLTATLPPYKEGAFYDRFEIDTIGNPPVVFRQPTTRSNIRYVVTKCDWTSKSIRQPKPQIQQDSLPPGMAMQLQCILDRFREDSSRKPGDRTIIYCPTVAFVQLISKRWNILQFYSGMPSEVKKKTLKDFGSEYTTPYYRNGRTICTTTALGRGMDFPNVRLVVHITPRFTIEDYQQGVGRGARGDGLCEANLINSEESMPKTFTISDSTPKNLLQYANSTTFCRRRILEFVLDGISDRERCSVGEAPCDICSHFVTINSITGLIESYRSTKYWLAPQPLTQPEDNYYNPMVIEPNPVRPSDNGSDSDLDDFIVNTSSMSAVERGDRDISGNNMSSFAAGASGSVQGGAIQKPLELQRYSPKEGVKRAVQAFDSSGESEPIHRGKRIFQSKKQHVSPGEGAIAAVPSDNAPLQYESSFGNRQFSSLVQPFSSNTAEPEEPESSQELQLATIKTHGVSAVTKPVITPFVPKLFAKSTVQKSTPPRTSNSWIFGNSSVSPPSAQPRSPNLLLNEISKEKNIAKGHSGLKTTVNALQRQGHSPVGNGSRAPNREGTVMKAPSGKTVAGLVNSPLKELETHDGVAGLLDDLDFDTTQLSIDKSGQSNEIEVLPILSPGDFPTSQASDPINQAIAMPSFDWSAIRPEPPASTFPSSMLLPPGNQYSETGRQKLQSMRFKQSWWTDYSQKPESSIPIPAISNSNSNLLEADTTVEVNCSLEESIPTRPSRKRAAENDLRGSNTSSFPTPFLERWSNSKRAEEFRASKRYRLQPIASSGGLQTSIPSSARQIQFQKNHPLQLVRRNEGMVISVWHDVVSKHFCLQRKCVICYVNQVPDSGLDYHDANTCKSSITHPRSNEIQKLSQQLWTRFIKEKRIPNYAGCFQCGMPQSMCDRWAWVDSEWRPETKVKCQYTRQLFDIGAALILDPNIFGGSTEVKAFLVAMFRERPVPFKTFQDNPLNYTRLLLQKVDLPRESTFFVQLALGALYHTDLSLSARDIRIQANEEILLQAKMELIIEEKIRLKGEESLLLEHPELKL